MTNLADAQSGEAGAPITGHFGFADGVAGGPIIFIGEAAVAHEAGIDLVGDHRALAAQVANLLIEIDVKRVRLPDNASSPVCCVGWHRRRLRDCL